MFVFINEKGTSSPHTVDKYILNLVDYDMDERHHLKGPFVKLHSLIIAETTTKEHSGINHF
jgi:hypothetical protein